MILQDGFEVIPGFFKGKSLERLEYLFNELLHSANQTLAKYTSSDLELSEYYKNKDQELIIVPEANKPNQLCRFENLAGHSTNFKMEIVEQFEELLKIKTQKPFTLFKDKCNLKFPNGGAFPAHQDYPAYQDFQPSIHITIAILLDEMNEENGCLKFAKNYWGIKTNNKTETETPFGKKYLFNIYKGKRNGEIIDTIQSVFNWTSIEANKGDILLFDSYIPHLSKKNLSNKSRKIIFLTFNLQEEGFHYNSYYKDKREHYSNPKFHIATPTRHNEL